MGSKSSNKLRGLGAILCSLVIASPLLSEDVPTFKVNVKVVNVLATVRDKHGAIVKDLGKDDFTLEEDGRPQTIKYFNRETDMPLTLGLLVDTSVSQVRVLDQERTGSAAFVDDVLRADKDSAFLIQFATEVELLQDLTKSPLQMSRALQQVDDSPRWSPDPNSGGGRSGRGGHRGGGSGVGTLLYDAIFLASDEMMQNQQGRKAIVVLTDGDDHGSRKSLDEAIEAAQRANTIVYGIYYTGGGRSWSIGFPGGGGRRHGGGGWPGNGSGWPTGSGDGKKVLERLSKETGGRMFTVSDKQPIGDVYAQIQDELRNQYNLGYTPDQPTQGPSDYRHIHIATKQRDLTVQAREGYYPSRQAESKSAQGQEGSLSENHFVVSRSGVLPQDLARVPSGAAVRR